MCGASSVGVCHCLCGNLTESSGRGFVSILCKGVKANFERLKRSESVAYILLGTGILYMQFCMCAGV